MVWRRNRAMRTGKMRTVCASVARDASRVRKPQRDAIYSLAYAVRVRAKDVASRSAAVGTVAINHHHRHHPSSSRTPDDGERNSLIIHREPSSIRGIAPAPRTSASASHAPSSSSSSSSSSFRTPRARRAGDDDGRRESYAQTVRPTPYDAHDRETTVERSFASARARPGRDRSIARTRAPTLCPTFGAVRADARDAASDDDVFCVGGISILGACIPHVQVGPAYACIPYLTHNKYM